MNFRKATDELLVGVTLENLADAMGVSVQSIRQARATEGTSAHRTPPAGWERGIRRLAERRAAELRRLAAQME
jgi:hypothetical protein